MSSLRCHHGYGDVWFAAIVTTCQTNLQFLKANLSAHEYPFSGVQHIVIVNVTIVCCLDSLLAGWDSSFSAGFSLASSAALPTPQCALAGSCSNKASVFHPSPPCTGSAIKMLLDLSCCYAISGLFFSLCVCRTCSPYSLLPQRSPPLASPPICAPHSSHPTSPPLQLATRPTRLKLTAANGGLTIDF